LPGSRTWPPAHCFQSRKLKPAECNFATHDREALAIVHAIKKWCCYVHMQPVTVLTDHYTLQYLKTQPHLTPRQAQWMENLEQYVPELKIEYRAGRLNPADSLTRQPQSQLTTISRYHRDPFYLNIAANNSSVYYESPFLYKEDSQVIFVPTGRKLHHLLLREHHDQNAHFGVDKTLAAISANFLWPKLSHDVRSYVRSCHTCQCNKARNAAPYGLLHPLEIPQVPWSHITLDFITDLPRTSSHHNAILTVVDRLKKMAHFLPTSTNAIAEAVADLKTPKALSKQEGYVGVRKRRGKWGAKIKNTAASKRVWLGTFDTAEVAALAYDAAARKLRGPHAWINFSLVADDSDS
ncbi:hypothetical protein CLOM_g18891, partial [Closterium sp. NIES-68]